MMKSGLLERKAIASSPARLRSTDQRRYVGGNPK
jgi:hypothetical protein